jgi:hypothetical protein
VPDRDGLAESLKARLASRYNATSNTIPVSRTEVERIIAALKAVPAASEVGWQPIESAPKDGTEILILAHGMAIQARYCPGEWSEDTPISPAEYGGALWVAFDDAVQFEIEETPHGDLHGAVTHWRPLPAPPALKASEREE